MTMKKTLDEYVTDLRSMASGKPTVIDPAALADAITEYMAMTEYKQVFGLRIIEGGKECVSKDHSEETTQRHSAK